MAPADGVAHRTTVEIFAAASPVVARHAAAGHHLEALLLSLYVEVLATEHGTLPGATDSPICARAVALVASQVTPIVRHPRRAAAKAADTVRRAPGDHRGPQPAVVKRFNGVSETGSRR
jgi:hypothetical protein